MLTIPRQKVLYAIYRTQRDYPRGRGLHVSELHAEIGKLDDFDMTYLVKKQFIEERNGYHTLTGTGIDEAELYLLHHEGQS